MRNIIQISLTILNSLGAAIQSAHPSFPSVHPVHLSLLSFKTPIDKIHWGHGPDKEPTPPKQHAATAVKVNSEPREALGYGGRGHGYEGRGGAPCRRLSVTRKLRFQIKINHNP